MIFIRNIRSSLWENIQDIL